MIQCRFPFDLLLGSIEKSLDKEAGERVEAHLATGCPDCSLQVARLEKLVRHLGPALSLDLPPVSEAALRKATDLHRAEAPAQKAGAIREWLGRLVFDNRSRPALAGARDASVSSAMRLYAAGPFQVDIWGEKLSGGDWYLIGQVSSESRGANILPESVSLSSGTGQAVSAVFEGAEFHIAPVNAGTYALTVATEGDRIRIEDLIVGE